MLFLGNYSYKLGQILSSILVLYPLKALENQSCISLLILSLKLRIFSKYLDFRFGDVLRLINCPH